MSRRIVLVVGATLFALLVMGAPINAQHVHALHSNAENAHGNELTYDAALGEWLKLNSVKLEIHRIEYLHLSKEGTQFTFDVLRDFDARHKQATTVDDVAIAVELARMKLETGLLPIDKARFDAALNNLKAGYYVSKGSPLMGASGKQYMEGRNKVVSLKPIVPQLDGMTSGYQTSVQYIIASDGSIVSEPIFALSGGLPSNWTVRYGTFAMTRNGTHATSGGGSSGADALAYDTNSSNTYGNRCVWTQQQGTPSSGLSGSMSGPADRIQTASESYYGIEEGYNATYGAELLIVEYHNGTRSVLNTYDYTPYSTDKIGICNATVSGTNTVSAFVQQSGTILNAGSVVNNDLPPGYAGIHEYYISGGSGIVWMKYFNAEGPKAIQFTAEVSGSTACVGSVCQGASHTLSATVGSAGGKCLPAIQPVTNYGSCGASEDFLDGSGNLDGIDFDGSVLCSVVGNFFNAGGSTYQTQVQLWPVSNFLTGTPVTTNGNPVVSWNYPLQNNCTPGTFNPATGAPDYSPGVVWEWETQSINSWKMSALRCERMVFTGGSLGPWMCTAQEENNINPSQTIEPAGACNYWDGGYPSPWPFHWTE